MPEQQTQKQPDAKKQVVSSEVQGIEGPSLLSAGPSDAVMREAKKNPNTLRATDVIYLQRTAGNQAVQRLLNPQARGSRPTRAHTPLSTPSVTIQTKLEVGPANDKYEQEADAMARKVMRMPMTPSTASQVSAKHNAQRKEDENLDGTKLQRAPISPLAQQVKSGRVNRKEESDVQRAMGMEGGPVSSDIESQIRGAQGGGKSLSSPIRAKMEKGIGADFSSVRVHESSQADSLNRSLNARAFTSGSDIFFKRGEFNPGSSGGQQLLAHELTHVVQQGSAPSTPSASRKIDKIVQPKRVVIQRSWAGVRNFFSKAGAKMRVGLGGAVKAGKTSSQVTDPNSVVTRAFRDYAVSTGREAPLNFMREYRALVDPAPDDIPWNAINAMLTKYNGQINGLDYNMNSPLENSVRLHKIPGLHPAPDVMRRRALQVVIKSVVDNAEQAVQNLVNGYNTAHARNAATPPVIPGPTPDATAFGNKGVAPTTYTTANIDPLQQPTQLGAGNVNTVYEHHYTTDPHAQVFKADAEVNDFYGRDAGTQVGIPEVNPEFAKRSVAMYRIDQLLNANVLGKTAFAVHDGKFGTVMEKASGRSYLDIASAGGAEKDLIANDPAFQRALSKVQLLDIICGQLDRHTGNYIIQRDAHNRFVALKGIDNDMAFGKDHTDITAKIGKGTMNTGGGVYQKNTSSTGKMGGSAHISEIQLLDQGFIDTIMYLDLQALRDALNGLLDPAEINATVARTKQLQQYLMDVQHNSLSNTLTMLNGPQIVGNPQSRAQKLVIQYRKHKAASEWQEAFSILQELRARATTLESAGKAGSVGGAPELKNLTDEYIFISQKLKLANVPANPFAGIDANSDTLTAAPMWAHLEVLPRLRERHIDDKALMAALWEHGDVGTRTRILRTLKTTGDQLRMSHMGYVLEAIDDPMHRMTLVNSAADWFAAGPTQDFFAWLATQAPPADPKAEYYDPAARTNAKVTVQGGRLLQPDHTATLKPISTDGEGWIIVLSGANEFYSKPKSGAATMLKTQHSSFMGGAPVESAGRIKTQGGRLALVENYSGHYKPQTRHLVKMILAFQAMGANLETTKVKDNDRLRTQQYDVDAYLTAAHQLGV